MSKDKTIQPPARTNEEVKERYFALTDRVQVKVDIAPEARKVVRDFVNSLADDLTIGDVREALEEAWS
ncbi:hypothetical protein [Asaia bogorensis]|uniref:hypothetical protein n=1 Tax=Asaia bogorensis TaxID=91915 RepID=UPI000EFB471E|nr:hypothetical protein [Asaia bogorensis]